MDDNALVEDWTGVCVYFLTFVQKLSTGLYVTTSQKLYIALNRGLLRFEQVGFHELGERESGRSLDCETFCVYHRLDFGDEFLEVEVAEVRISICTYNDWFLMESKSGTGKAGSFEILGSKDLNCASSSALIDYYGLVVSGEI